MRVILACLLLGSVHAAFPETPAASVQSVTEVRTSEPGGSELRLWIRLEGVSLAEALEYHSIRLRDARDDRGTSLTLAQEVSETPARLKKPGSGTVPSVLFPLALQIPARDARALTHAAGSVTLRQFRRQVVLIDHVRSKVNQTAKDPLFEAHGVEIFITDPVQGSPGAVDEKSAERIRAQAVSVRVSGNPGKVLGVDLLAADGSEIPARSGSFGAGRSVLHTLTADRPLPEKIQARIALAASPHDVEVPFTLNNIPLP
jgi:hypothetical protein